MEGIVGNRALFTDTGAILKKDTDMHHTEDLSGKRMIISAVATLVCLIVLYVFYIGLIRHEFSSERDRYSYIARNEAEHIVTTIDCVMARTNTLKALIQDHDGDTSFFNDVAESIYNDVIDETGVTAKGLDLGFSGCPFHGHHPDHFGPDRIIHECHAEAA